MRDVIEYAKPLPTPDPDTQPFWDACKEHEVRAQRCTGCGRFRWPPNPLCPHCRSWDFEWVKLAGTGEVYSYVVVHYSAVPVFAAEMPYVVAHITMDGADGAVRLVSNIVDCPWEEVRVGMRVAVVFEDVTPEFSLPKFRPLGS
jgi:uncharacterized OB-fold protein